MLNLGGASRKNACLFQIIKAGTFYPSDIELKYGLIFYFWQGSIYINLFQHLDHIISINRPASLIISKTNTATVIN
jgi:hypothetical protein